MWMGTAKENTKIYEEVRWTQHNFSTVRFREKAENYFKGVSSELPYGWTCRVLTTISVLKLSDLL